MVCPTKIGIIHYFDLFVLLESFNKHQLDYKELRNVSWSILRIEILRCVRTFLLFRDSLENENCGGTICIALEVNVQVLLILLRKLL